MSILLVLLPIAIAAEPSKESQSLVEIFGWKEVYRDVVAPPGWADLSERDRREFEEKTEFSLDQLMEDLAVWIDREFTEDERSEILAFLESDVGRKFSTIFFRDRDGSGELHQVVGDWIAGRYQQMESHLDGR